MKKILSLLVCLCMIIGMLPAFTVSAAEEAPEWVATIGTMETPGTLIGSYTFANTDVPGQAIPNNFPTDATVASNEYAAEYVSDGFKITKLQDGTTENNGKSTSYHGRINFVGVTDEASKSYESGFRGTYVVDMTINTNMVKPEANTSSNAPRLDMWLGYNDDLTSYENTNETKYNGLRFTSAQKLALYDNKTSGSKEYCGGGARSDERGVDTVHRFVFDTVNAQIAHYILRDGAYLYIGAGQYYGDSVQGMTFNPRLGFAKDSYFIFKDVKIYEVERAQEPLIKVVNTPVTPDPEPTPDPEGPDPDNIIPDWVELIGADKTPGTLLEDYNFEKSNVPGKNIPNNFPEDESGEYKGEYTTEGFKFTRLKDGTDESSGKSSNLKGRINFVNITDEATNSYESGFRGTYVIDATIKADMSRTAGMTKNVRFDMTFGYNEDISAYDNAEADPKWNNMRFMHDNSWRLYDNLSSYAVEYVDGGSSKRNTARGEDETYRFVFDTVNKQIAFYKLIDNEFAYVGSGEFFGDSVQGIMFTPRLGFAKDSYFIFKNVKLYEVERAQEPLIKVDNTSVTPDPDPTPDPDNNIPDWVESFGSNPAPGELVDSHGFDNSDVPGRKVYNSFSDTTNFSGTYTADGFKLARATDFVSGTGPLASGEFMRINLTKKVGEEYKYGLNGTYAIDLTVNGKFASSQKKSDVYLNGYMVCSDKVDSLSVSNNTNLVLRFIAEQGRTGNTHFQILSASDVNVKTELAPVLKDKDTVIRLIVDSETGNVALYTSEDNKATFKYYGALDGVFKGKNIQSMMFEPGLGLVNNDVVSSAMTFKNVDIYEIIEVEDTEDPNPTPDPDPGAGDIVADPTNLIPDWAEVIGLTAEPGKKVGDYLFNGGSAPGEKVANTFADSADFSGEYTEDGFVLKKLTDPDPADRATESGFYGAINFVSKLENDEENKTTSYQHGLVGTYVVDLYVNSNLSMNISGSAARFDWSMGYLSNLDGTKVESTFNTIRVTSANSFTVYGASSYAQGSTSLPKGQDTIVRMVVDTKNGQMAYFIYKNNEFTFAGSGEYKGDILQTISFTPRLGFAKGSTFTFKGVKIYEIERYTDPVLGAYDRNQQIMDAMADEAVMPKSLSATPDAVIENLTIPSGTWTTSNDEVINAAGVVKRGFEDSEVTLTNKFKTTSTPSLQLFKTYSFTVPKRDDVVNKVLVSAEPNIPADNDIVVFVADSVASDKYSETFVENLSGVYDFEMEVTPTLSAVYGEGATPAKIALSYYDLETGEFTDYATVNVYKDVIKYSTNATSVKTVPVNNGVKNTIKFRIDTKNKNIWIYINGVQSGVMGYSGNSFVNSLIVYLDKDEASTDSIVLNKMNLVSLFAFDNTEFVNSDILDCAEVAKTLTVYNVTSNPDDAYGNLADMPKTLGKYSVSWSANSDSVDINAKYAYRSEEDETVTVTAQIYDSKNPEIYVLKDFDITIIGTTDPEVLLEGSTSKLAARFITNQSANNLVTDIVLPTELDGNKVTWKSSNPDILSANGVINNNKNISEPTKVTLTATVTDGKVSVTKAIDFVVAKRGKDVVLFNSSANIETPVTGVVTYAADINGSASLVDSEGKKIIDIEGNGNVKVVMDFNTSKVSVFKDGVLVEDYIDFAEKAVNFAKVVSTDVNNEQIIVDEYSLFNYNVEKFGYLDVIGKNYITSDVEMSTSTIGGAVVKWNSKNTAILTNEGKFNSPENVSYFDIEFEITLPGGTGAVRKDVIKVVAMPENNIFAGANVSNTGTSYPAGEYQTNMMFDGNYADTMFRGEYINATKSIVIDLLNKQDINKIFVANKGLISCDIYVSDDKNEWTLVASPVFDGTIESFLVSFNKENTRYIKLENLVYEGNFVDVYEIAGFTVYDSTDKSYIDIMELNMPTEFVLEATKITLPSIGSMYGSKLTWKSSNTDVISLDGTITKPKNNTEVLLTVTSENNGSVSTKTFRYYIKGKEGAQGGTSAGGSGGGGGGSFAGNTSSAAFPETNATQTPIVSTVKEFNDVSKDSWFYGYVMDLRKDGIIDGDDNNNFNPSSYVTREEFVKMIINAAGIETVAGGEGFKDVDSSAWYAPYVYAAKENGIVNGTSADTFGVGAYISRQDMSVIIDNVIDVVVNVAANKDLFADDSTISDYAYDSVYSMKALGIINGYEDGNFNPKGQLTRAEAAKVIAMVMDIIK